jgi:hypothetical protein
MRLTPGPMFVCKARNLTLNVAPERSFTLLGSNITNKIKLERPAKDKIFYGSHSQQFIFFIL